MSDSYFEGVRTGEGFVDRGVDAFYRARDYRDKLTARDEEKTMRAAATAKDESRYNDSQIEKLKKDKIDAERATAVEGHAKKQDEYLDAEIQNIKKGLPARGAVGGHASPALLNLREQYKQLSNDMRQKSQPGFNPPPDLIKRYNSVGKALNAQAKHEDPNSVEVEFVPIPETPDLLAKPGASGNHPVVDWMTRTLGFGGSEKTASGVEDWKTYDK